MLRGVINIKACDHRKWLCFVWKVLTDLQNNLIDQSGVARPSTVFFTFVLLEGR